jgi:hypothetical protein
LIADIGTQLWQDRSRWAAPDAVSFGEGRQYKATRCDGATSDRGTTYVDHEKLHKYVTKFHLPPPMSIGTLHLESPIFFDKTGSEMTSGI